MKISKIDLVLDQVLELYNDGNGKTLTEIEKLLNLPKKSLSKKFKKLGISVKRTNGGYINRICSVNESVFEIIDTEEKAYWLGFLYADGYIYSHGKKHGVELTLQAVDYEHLVKFKNFMGSKHKIAYKETANAYRINITSKKIAQDLINLGCVQAKSLILQFPTLDQVPEELVHHFMRGYFDGDGCISQFEFSVVGTSEFLDSYEQFLIQGINRTTTTKRYHDKRWSDKTEAIRYGGSKQVSKIFHFLYNNATIYLDRKYDKFNMLLPSQNETDNNSEIISAELSGETVKSQDTQPEPKANSDISQGQSIDSDPCPNETRV